MKFMLLIGGSHAAWNAMSESMWKDSEATHARIIAELQQSGEFIACEELRTKTGGARDIRAETGTVKITDGPLDPAGNFASGYYLVEVADLDRATEITAQLYETRFAPIEVREVGPDPEVV